jgi:hypothetical protein
MEYFVIWGIAEAVMLIGVYCGHPIPGIVGGSTLTFVGIPLCWRIQNGHWWFPWMKR